MSALDDISFAVERITPARAARYLETNVGNRKCSEKTVSKYAKAIAAGEWLMNGETIKFNGSNKLLDGQHRLQAIVQAKTPVAMCVIRGLKNDAFKTFDQGKARTNADCLYILDYKHPHALAAAGRMLVAYEREWERHTRSFRTVSNDELLDVIKRHPKLVKDGHRYMLRPLFTTLIPHSLGMFTFYLANRINPADAERFFRELSSGDYLKSRADWPTRVLREQLEKTSREYLKPDTYAKLTWVVQAWNAYINKEASLRRLSRVVDKAPRFFPDPVKPARRKSV